MRKILTSVSMCFLALIVGFSFAACGKKGTSKLGGYYTFETISLFGLEGDSDKIAAFFDEATFNEEKDPSMLKMLLNYITKLELNFKADNKAEVIVREIATFVEAFDDESQNMILGFLKDAGLLSEDGDIIAEVSYATEDGKITFGNIWLGDSFIKSFILGEKPVVGEDNGNGGEWTESDVESYEEAFDAVYDDYKEISLESFFTVMGGGDEGSYYDLEKQDDVSYKKGYWFYDLFVTQSGNKVILSVSMAEYSSYSLNIYDEDGNNIGSEYHYGVEISRIPVKVTLGK